MWNYRARLTNGHIPESEKSGAGEKGESSEFSGTFRNFVIAKTQLILVPIMATIKRRGVYYAFNRVKTIDPDDCRNDWKDTADFLHFRSLVPNSSQDKRLRDSHFSAESNTVSQYIFSRFVVWRSEFFMRTNGLSWINDYDFLRPSFSTRTG